MAEKVKREYEELHIGDATYNTILTDKYKNRKPYSHPKNGEIFSFIPGTIEDIFIKEGQKVEKGEVLLILEAMKMKNRIVAPISGKVLEIRVKKGDLVPNKHLIVVIK